MKPAPGTLVTRNVKLVRPLGKGGMGSVWVGEHTTLETEVAVKFISPEHAEKKRFVDRFQREASSAAKIKSPHVVQVFDHGVTDGVPYIVMELLHGEPLSRRLRRGPLTARECAMLVSQVCKVLTIAHELGIVHRDLKPDNLYLLESGYELFVKVLDFGIAKQLVGELNDITDTGAMVGTPYYMSPEMLLSPKDADHSADLWALAVVAYHALTSELPFRGETLAALSVAINDGGFKPPSSIVDNLGPEVDVWFKLALCRNIEGRFGSAAELVQGLRQALLDSSETSGDRTSEPLDSDSLPETVRHSHVDALSATEGAQPITTLTDLIVTSHATEADTADRTVTSEQLAKIRSDDGVVSGDAQTLVAGQSTLEGTASSGDAHRPAWGRRIGVAALALAAVAMIAVSQRQGARPALSSQAAQPSLAVSASGAPKPQPSDSPPAAASSAIEPRRTGTPESSQSAAVLDPRRPATTKRRPVPPPIARPTPKPKAKCANPFIVDANGDLQPRPGCF